MTPSESDFWFLPLGGTGEIGMNMNLYGHDEQWLMVDCGITFAKQTEEEKALGLPASAPPIQMADPEFIAQRRESLVGLVITHAHEDHIGAVAYIWEQLQCPVYTTRFTAEILVRKLQEVGLQKKVPIHIVDPSRDYDIGVFNVRWIGLTHSIPDAFALLITTSVAKIFHTADWKLDPTPVLGEPYSESTYREVGALGIDAMVCDSTTANVLGHSTSEAALHADLYKIIESAPGRVVVSCFGSNLARMKTLYDIARSCNRHIALLGRSMLNMADAAKVAGVWRDQQNIVDNHYLCYLPKESVLAIATGSQGQSRTALHRLSHDNFYDMQLEAGDTVIFSSRAIPGNEDDIEAMVERLEGMGITVITDENTDYQIHASGHPAIDELKMMYDWIQPKMSIPVHGEPQHLKAHAELAKSLGVPHQQVGRNGDMYFIAPYRGIRRQAVATGRLGLVNRKLSKIED
ncbi:ribonuclease J [Leucothrix sargassi]|nr:ribonuclease J [Leucothrix sargassi]